MASLDLTLKIDSVQGNTAKARVIASGTDLSNHDFEVEFPFDFKDAIEDDFDIPGSPCKLHISLFLENPHKLCVDGHLQCGPVKITNPERFCVAI